jgi:hypothetical protein
MTHSEATSKALEILRIEAEYTDDPAGPWLYADGRPRRCHARSSQTGRRCARWSEPARDYCKFHGGRQPQVRLKKMPAAYAAHLRPALAERLQDFLGSKRREEQLEIFEEIALARTMLTEALDIAKVIHGQGAEMELAAQRHVRDMMDTVADLCVRMARIGKDLADTVNVGALGMFVEEITRMMYARLGDQSDVARALADDLRQLRLPASGAQDPRVPLDAVVEVSFDDDD